MKLVKILKASVFIFIIIGAIIFLYINKDTVFKETKIILYPDKCEEKYIGGELVTDVCVQGRLLDEMKERRYKERWNDWILPDMPNITINLS